MPSWSTLYVSYMFLPATRAFLLERKRFESASILGASAIKSQLNRLIGLLFAASMAVLKGLATARGTVHKHLARTKSVKELSPGL